MGQDEETLNTEPPRKDALDGFTPMMTGLRPRNLVRCPDVTFIAGIPASIDAVNSRVHWKFSPTFIFTNWLLGPSIILEPEQAEPLTMATES